MHEASREKQPCGPAVSCCFGQPHQPPRGPLCSCWPPGQENGPAALSSALRRFFGGAVTLEDSEPHVGEQLQALSVSFLSRRRPVAVGPSVPRKPPSAPAHSGPACGSCYVLSTYANASLCSIPGPIPLPRWGKGGAGKPSPLPEVPPVGQPSAVWLSCALSCSACLSAMGSPSLSRGWMRLACV